MNGEPQQIFYYHLTNTFIPTSSLLVIVEVTIYFEEPRSGSAIWLSLMVMLVMHTLYQSINQSLIKTAYLEMIDYWLIFCLLIPIVIFLIKIHWLLFGLGNPAVNINSTKKCIFLTQKFCLRVISFFIKNCQCMKFFIH